MPKLQGKVVIQYLSDERWKNLPSLTLARKIYNENKKLYTTIDAVRTIIRYYRGTTGDKKRIELMDKRFVDYNPYKLPQSDEADYFPFVLPKKATNILLLSDIHVPYHSIEALNAAIEYGLKEKVNAIVLNGDIWDCYQGSSFNPDPRKRRMNEERESVKDFLKELKTIFSGCYFFYSMGNHEERWERYFKVKAPEVLGMPEFEIENVLGLRELGYEFQTCKKQIVKAGSLNIVHGHEFGRSIFSPVNVARGLFLRAKTSAICGHHHQTSEHTESNMNGKIITTWSQGCLCELHPEYNPLNTKHNHGFAHIQLENDTFKVNNIRIVDGEIL